VAPAAAPRASATVAATITATATISVSQPASDGDIRLRRRRPPVVFDKSAGKCIAKGGGTGCGDLFE